LFLAYPPPPHLRPSEEAMDFDEDTCPSLEISWPASRVGGTKDLQKRMRLGIGFPVPLFPHLLSLVNIGYFSHPLLLASCTALARNSIRSSYLLLDNPCRRLYRLLSPLSSSYFSPTLSPCEAPPSDGKTFFRFLRIAISIPSKAQSCLTLFLGHVFLPFTDVKYRHSLWFPFVNASTVDRIE